MLVSYLLTNIISNPEMALVLKAFVPRNSRIKIYCFFAKGHVCRSFQPVSTCLFLFRGTLMDAQII